MSSKVNQWDIKRFLKFYKAMQLANESMRCVALNLKIINMSTIPAAVLSTGNFLT